MEIARKKTVAFTGYRTSKILRDTNDSNLLNVIAVETHKVVLSLCEQGFTKYLCGMAEGFDLIAGEAVIKAQKEFPEIELIAVIPFMGQELSYSRQDKERYHELYHRAADRIFVSDSYHDKAFHNRNDFMLNHCNQLVCYYDGQRSGTMYTYNRAERQNIPIINIRLLILDYIHCDTPIHEKLRQFHFIKHVTFAKDRLILSGINDAEIPYDNIETVEHIAANMCLTLRNGIVYKISTVSDSWRMAFPQESSSPLRLLWWKLCGDLHSLFKKR